GRNTPSGSAPPTTPSPPPRRYLPRMSLPWRWSSASSGFLRFAVTWGGRICAFARHDATVAADGFVRGSHGTTLISSLVPTWPSSASCCCSFAQPLALLRVMRCRAAHGFPLALSAVPFGACSTKRPLLV